MPQQTRTPAPPRPDLVKVEVDEFARQVHRLSLLGFGTDDASLFEVDTRHFHATLVEFGLVEDGGQGTGCVLSSAG